MSAVYLWAFLHNEGNMVTEGRVLFGGYQNSGAEGENRKPGPGLSVPNPV